MVARIFCKTGTLSGAVFEIGDEATVGSTSENAIMLAAKTISRRHARIFFDAEKDHYLVEDLGSRNGTWVDGTRVRGMVRLDDLAVITFARMHDFIFQRVAADAVLSPIVSQPRRNVVASAGAGEETFYLSGDAIAAAENAASEAPAPASDSLLPGGGAPAPGSDSLLPGGGAPAPASDSPRPGIEPAAPGSDSHLPGIEPAAPGIDPPAPPRFVLELELRSGRWTPFALAEGDNVLGRSSRCEVQIDTEEISRRHAALTVSRGRLTVRDLGATNPTFVDGVRVSAEVEVSPSSELRFGPVRARVRRRSR